MEAQSSNAPLTCRCSKRKNWTVKEKRVVFTLLKKHGHKNLQPFVNSFPHRTELEIKRFLRKYQTTVEKKLCLKHDENVEQTLTALHPWLPFMNNYCDSGCSVHENLVAFAIPFMERYLKHPNPTLSESVKFEHAYRALFNSMLGRKFPEDMNHETFALIFASLTQLFDDIRTEQVDHRDILSKCVERCLQKKPNQAEMGSQCPNAAIQLPEINVLKLTSGEINQVCNK